MTQKNILEDYTAEPREYVQLNLLEGNPSLPWKFKMLKSAASKLAEKTRKRYNAREEWRVPLLNGLVNGMNYAPISDADETSMNADQARERVADAFLEYFGIDVSKPPEQQVLDGEE